MSLTTRLQTLFRRADHWSDRTRAWMITIVAACCVGIFCAIWAVYAATHVNTRYEQTAPGEAATVQQATYRMLGLRRTDVIQDGEEQKPAPANATWVVADMEVRIPHRLEYVGCSLSELVAVGERSWEPTSDFYSREGIPVGCSSDEIPIDRPYHFQLIYEVPLKYVDQVYGVAVEDPSSPAPAVVFTPPAR